MKTNVFIYYNIYVGKKKEDIYIFIIKIINKLYQLLSLFVIIYLPM